MRCGVSVGVILLVWVAGGQALELPGAAAANRRANFTVRCWCPTYPNVTLCSWPETPGFPPPLHYVATYRERRRQTVGGHGRVIPPGAPLPMDMPSSSSSSSSSDRLWHCYLPNLKLFTDYIINITAVYPGVSRSHLTTFMLEDIIQPDPPVDVEVSYGMRNVTVRWSPPPTWANLHIFPLQYHVLYQWENRGTPKSVNMGPLMTPEVELRSLTPGRNYTLKVYAKDLLDLGKSSTWSSEATVIIPP